MLCEDISIIIIKYVCLIYQQELKEINQFRSKNHIMKLIISFNYYSFGLKFGGARNDKVGRKNMYGIFISDIKENSSAYEYMQTNQIDFRGFQIIRFNNMITNHKTTLKELKEYRKLKPNANMILKLKWNPELLKAYNYNFS